MTETEYNGPIAELEIRNAEAALKLTLPKAWREFIQSHAWFRRGWMKTGAYVWLYTPSESVEYWRAWGAPAAERPGMIIIGGDGGGELITIDARTPDSPVTLTPNVSVGWEDSIEQAASIADFIAAINDGSFDFAFGEED
jgi:hypothetical protein